MAKMHLHRSIFFYVSIMYLSVRYTPNEYRSVGYIPTEQHSPSAVEMKTWLAQDCALNACLSPASNISFKKKNHLFLGHSLVPEVIANSSKWTEIFLHNFVFLGELWFPRKHFCEQAL